MTEEIMMDIFFYIFKKRKQTFDEEKYFCLFSFKYERTYVHGTQ